MSRYFVEIAYKGTNFSGWQRQPNALTVQEVIEDKLSILLNQTTPILGCGRTDAGVHASHYIFHFETDQGLPDELPHRLDRMLGTDIVAKSMRLVPDDLHARFSATARAYKYHVTREQSPFTHELKTYYTQFDKIDKKLLDEMSRLIKAHTEFFPFCKSNSDAETMNCIIKNSRWEYRDGEYIYRIQANRFLRGMVRLIVGMSLRVSIGEVEIALVEEALVNQTRLAKSWSVPASGLFLSEVLYEND